MIVAFARDDSLVSYLIRLFTWSKWHHCGALTLDKKFVIEATAKNGVVQTPLAEFIARYDEVEFGEIKCNDRKAEKFLLAQLGKKYDWLAIFGMLFRKNWQDDCRWFCFELVAAATGLFDDQKQSKVAANSIYLISKPATI